MLISGDCFRPPPQPRDLASAWFRSQECLAHKTRILSARVFAWEIGTNRSGRWLAAPPSPARHTLNCPNINLEQLSWSGALSTQGFTPSNIIRTRTNQQQILNIKKNHKSANNDSKYNVIPTERVQAVMVWWPRCVGRRKEAIKVVIAWNTWPLQPPVAGACCYAGKQAADNLNWWLGLIDRQPGHPSRVPPS